MPERNKSIYELKTTSTVPPPQSRWQVYVVERGDTLITIANKVYGLKRYDPNAWREIALANGVNNPFTFERDFIGKPIKIPPKPLPEFT